MTVIDARIRPDDDCRSCQQCLVTSTSGRSNGSSASDEPGIRLQARRDLLDEEITWTADDVLAGRHASSLLSGQKSDGGFGTHPYNKWMGAHWRVISLVELGLPPGEPRALAAEETVLDWLLSEQHRTYMPTIRDLPRRHGSMEGNALAVCCRLGMAADPRVALLADSLIEWQWPDGGWNCDKTPATTHSSFYESLPPVWGLTEYSRATGSSEAAAAARRAADFFLDHHVFQSHTTGEVGDPKWMSLRYPEYWHYDFLHGLVMLARAGALPDARADEAITLLQAAPAAGRQVATQRQPVLEGRPAVPTATRPGGTRRPSARC